MVGGDSVCFSPRTTRKRVSVKASLILCPAVCTHVLASSQKDSPVASREPPTLSFCPGEASGTRGSLSGDASVPMAGTANLLMAWLSGQGLPLGGGTQANRILDPDRLLVKGCFAELA